MGLKINIIHFAKFIVKNFYNFTVALIVTICQKSRYILITMYNYLFLNFLSIDLYV